MGANQNKMHVVVDETNGVGPGANGVPGRHPLIADQSTLQKKKKVGLLNIFKFKKLVAHEPRTAATGAGFAVDDASKTAVSSSIVFEPPPACPSSTPSTAVDSIDRRVGSSCSKQSTSTPSGASLVVECRDITTSPQQQQRAGGGRVREYIDPKLTTNYVIEALIGKGSFSRVVRGTQRQTGEKVAVKMVPAKHGTGVFENELSILQRVDHPFVIQLHEVYRTPSRVYMVLELASGGELYDRIVAKGRFTEEETMKAMKMILNGLNYLHKIGITHRDLKPENLLYIRPKPDSRLLITDFGLAHMQQQAHGVRTMTETCGTPEYIAPEVLLRQRYNNKVDLWAVGVIAYILLSGVMPFDDDCRTRLYRQIIRGKYYFYPEFWSHVSKEARSFVAALLETDGEERLSSEEALNHFWMRLLSPRPRPSVAAAVAATDLTVTITTKPPPPHVAKSPSPAPLPVTFDPAQQPQRPSAAPPAYLVLPMIASAPAKPAQPPPTLHNGYHGPPMAVRPPVNRPSPNMERTRSVRSIRSLPRSDHGRRVDPKEVERLCKDPEVRRWLAGTAPSGRQIAHSDYGTLESTKDYGLF